VPDRARSDPKAGADAASFGTGGVAMFARRLDDLLAAG
jgi:hypothetical protein